MAKRFSKGDPDSAPYWPDDIVPFVDYRADRPFVYDPPGDGPRIIYEDADILGIDKPAGLLSIPGRSQPDSALSRLERSHPGVLLTHRLDVATSGVMIFARTPQAQKHIGQQFEARRTQKRYVARVWGRMSGDGEIDLPLRHDVNRRPMQCICEKYGRPALTRWTAGESGDTSRLLLEPVTGRSHQLRAHLVALGHPILGDMLYAHDDAYLAADRLMLHAESLTLRHPRTGEAVTLKSESPF